MAADVFSQPQYRARIKLFVFFGTQYLVQGNQFTGGIGNFQSDNGFTRDHVNDAHTDHRQRTGQVFGEVADLAAFHTRRRLQFKPCDDRSRIDCDYFHLYVEINQLQFHLARHGLKGCFRKPALGRFGRIQQTQGGQCRISRHLKQGFLFFRLGTAAGFHSGNDRFNAWQRPVLDSILLFPDLGLPFLLYLQRLNILL